MQVDDLMKDILPSRPQNENSDSSLSSRPGSPDTWKPLDVLTTKPDSNCPENEIHASRGSQLPIGSIGEHIHEETKEKADSKYLQLIKIDRRESSNEGQQTLIYFTNWTENLVKIYEIYDTIYVAHWFFKQFFCLEKCCYEVYSISGVNQMWILKSYKDILKTLPLPTLQFCSNIELFRYFYAPHYYSPNLINISTTLSNKTELFLLCEELYWFQQHIHCTANSL